MRVEFSHLISKENPGIEEKSYKGNKEHILILEARNSTFRKKNCLFAFLFNVYRLVGIE